MQTVYCFSASVTPKKPAIYLKRRHAVFIAARFVSTRAAVQRDYRSIVRTTVTTRRVALRCCWLPVNSKIYDDDVQIPQNCPSLFEYYILPPFELAYRILHPTRHSNKGSCWKRGGLNFRNRHPFRLPCVLKKILTPISSWQYILKNKSKKPFVTQWLHKIKRWWT